MRISLVIKGVEDSLRAREVRQVVKDQSHLPMPILDRLIYLEGLKHAEDIPEIKRASETYRRLK